jgi:hypothetical protein
VNEAYGGGLLRSVANEPAKEHPLDRDDASEKKAEVTVNESS